MLSSPRSSFKLIAYIQNVNWHNLMTLLQILILRRGCTSKWILRKTFIHSCKHFFKTFLLMYKIVFPMKSGSSFLSFNNLESKFLKKWETEARGTWTLNKYWKPFQPFHYMNYFMFCFYKYVFSAFLSKQLLLNWKVL